MTRELLIWTGTALAMWGQLPGEAGGGYRMLWLGSSSAYYHDMPEQVGNWLEDYGGYPEVEARLAGRSGTGIQRYLEAGFKAEYGLRAGQTVLEKIREERPQMVVLQVPVDFLAGGGQGNDSAAFQAALETYAEVARGVGAQVLIYEMGWTNEEVLQQGDRILEEVAKRLQIPVAPCRHAWQRVRVERPDLELWNLPDRSHPGTLGAYLNFCVFQAALTGQVPAELPTEIRVWFPPKTEEARAEGERKAAATAWGSYGLQLAGWMRRNAATAKLVSIEKGTARYLQRVAGETWQTTQGKLGIPAPVRPGETR